MSSAVPPVDLLLRAKNEASLQVKKLAADVGGLDETVGRLTAGLGVWGAIAAGATAAGAAVIAVSKKFSDEVESIDRVRAATGAQVSEVQTLRLAYTQQGLASEEADRALEKMAVALGRNDPLFKKLGISTRDVYQATIQASKAMAATSDPGTRAAIATTFFGKAATDATGPIAGLAAAAEEAQRKLKASGAAISPEDADRARRLDDALDSLSLSLQGLGKVTASSFAPAATTITTGLTGIIAVMLHLQDAAQDDESHGLLWWLKKQRDEGDKKAFAWIDQAIRKFDELQQKLHDFNPLLFKAPDKFQSIPTGDKLQALFAGIGGPMGTTPTPPGTVDEARETRLKQIIELLRVGRKDGEMFLRILEGIEEGKKRIALKKEIFEGLGGIGDPGDLVKVQQRGPLQRAGFVDHDAGVQGPEPKPIAKLMPAVDLPVTAPKLRAQVDALTERFPRLSEAITDVNIRWGDLVQSILSAQGIIDGAYGALFDGLQSGWHSVIAHMNDETQTFGSAAKSIIGAVTDQLKALIAQMLATGIFKLVTQLVTFAAGSAVSGAAGGPPSGPGFGMPTPRIPGIDAMARQTVVNLNVSAIDANDAHRAAVLPFGSLRLAAEGMGALG
jgi:hypothetical protein